MKPEAESAYFMTSVTIKLVSPWKENNVRPKERHLHAKKYALFQLCFTKVSQKKIIHIKCDYLKKKKKSLQNGFYLKS